MSLMRKLAVLAIGALMTVLPLGRAFAQGGPTAAVEVVELARALKNDPDLIYEYVYNNIETIPIYGSLKGPLGALIDRKGSAVDQAELMLQLLQQAAINNPAITNPQLQTGTVWITQSQLMNWLGTDANPTGTNIVLATGGIPNHMITSGASPFCAIITETWVQVTISGQTVVFDPGNKVSKQAQSDLNAQGATCQAHSAQPVANGYNRVAGIDLAAAAGYASSTFIAHAEAGATITDRSVAGLNRTNVRGDLTTYSNNLVAWIRANKPAASTNDILGGKTIAPLPIGTHQRWTALPYACTSAQSGTCVDATTSTAVPSNLRTTLSVTVPGASAAIFNSSDIYGQRLSVFFNGSNQPVLALDGDQKAIGSQVGNGASVALSVSIIHPGAGMNQSGSLNVAQGGQYIIAQGWGGVSRAMIERHRRRLLLNQQANPGQPSSEPVLGETISVMANTWIAEVSAAKDLVQQTSGVEILAAHNVGIAGVKAVGSGVGPFVDLPLNFLRTVQLTGRPNVNAFTAVETSAFVTMGGLSSVFESGIIEQTQPGNAAVSTVKLLDQASQTDTIYDINNPAVSGDDAAYWTSTIKPAFQSFYTSTIGQADLANINSVVTTKNFRVIAALHGPQTINQWSGSGYFQVLSTNTSITFGATISGGLSGGFSTSPESYSVYTGNTSTVAITPIGTPDSFGSISINVGVGNTQLSVAMSPDPVNMVSGSFTSDHDDLTVGTGGAPYSLTFSRHYESASYLAPAGALGLGWTHNFLGSAHADSDGFSGMGVDSPISGASAIATAVVLQDLLNGGSNAKPLDRLIIAVQAERWLMDQLTGNTVNVIQGVNSLQFIKLADGTYNAPLKSNASLTQAPSNGPYTLTTVNKTKFVFNTAGNLASIQNPAGTTVTLNYNGSNQLTSVSNGMGRTLTLGYTGSLITSVTDGTRTVHYTYDGASNLTAYQDPASNSITYQYDKPGRLTKIFYPSFPTNAFVTNTYSSLDKVNSQIDANGHETDLYLAGSRAELVDALGNSDVQYLSPRGDTTIHISALGAVTTSAYDNLGRLVSTTLPEGNGVTYAYDNVDGPTKLQNVLTITTTPKPGSGAPTLTQSFTYEPAFNGVATSTDANGNVTSSLYDTAGGTGNLLEIDQPAVGGQVPKTTFTYNARGQVLTKADPTGKVTLSAYDTATEVLLSTTDDNTNLKIKVQYGYDAVGNVTSVTDPNSNTSTMTYDALRRVTQITGPTATGAITKTTYNADGLATQVQRATGNSTTPWETTSATYSPSGKKLTTTDGNGNVTTYTYDALDRVATVKDPANRTTSFAYDALGRSLSTSNTAIQAPPLVQYSYSANGQRKTLTDANGNVSTYVYDGQDRLAGLQYPSATRGAGTSDPSNAEAYAYDANGNVLTHTRRDGSVITATYDVLNRPLTKQYPGHVGDVYFTYDLAGRITSQRYGSVTGSGVIYGYDTAGRVTSEATNGRTMAYQYDAAGNRIRVTWPDTFYVTYTVDALNRVTAIAENGAATGPGVLATYTYDPLSRRTGGALGNGASMTYGYDAGDRLTALTHTMPSDASAQNLSLTFGYTAASQLQSRSSSNVAYEWNGYGTGTTNNTADGLNRDGAIAALTGGYDANGNVTNDGSRTFTYDFDNRLSSVAIAASSTAVSLAYDPASRLQQQQTTAGAGSPVTTQYLYDGQRLSAEYDGSGNILRRYVHGPGTDQPIVWYEGSGTTDRRWLHTDERGSVVAYSKLTGAATVASYGPYGEPAAWGGSRFAYTGQIQLAEVQLYHYKGRVYDPVAGQFLQIDPIGYAGGYNLYGYAGGDPTDLADPLGTTSQPGGGWNSSSLAGGAAGGLINASWNSGEGQLTDVANSYSTVAYIGYHQINGLPDVYHTFIVVSPSVDSDTGFTFRGGPVGDGPPGSVQSPNASGDSSGHYCTFYGCGYGNIHVDTGASASNIEHKDGGPAFFSGPYSVPMSYNQAVSNLNGIANYVNGGGFGYGPGTTNSNTITSIGLNHIGVGHPNLGVIAPGYGSYLPQRH